MKQGPQVTQKETTDLPAPFRFVVKKMNKGFKSSSLLAFTGAILSNPREVGACCPSSSKMSRVIASKVPVSCKGLVVELGAGTGAVTQALLDRGVDPEQLVVVEKNPQLARYLSCRFSQVTVINGDAAELGRLLGPHRQNVSCVVSSLPLFCLPENIVRAIGRELKALIGPEGTIIQYTYQITRKKSRLPDCFKRMNVKFVWRNIPPARVDVYRMAA